MGVSYVSSNSAVYSNINDCRSFNQTLSTTLVGLSSYVCSEVIIINKTGQEVLVFDSGFSGASNSLLLDDNDSIVLRGLTNAEQVSCKTSSGGGTLYFRTQFYSNLPQR